jgi:hypothetical protein
MQSASGRPVRWMRLNFAGTLLTRSPAGASEASNLLALASEFRLR